MRQTVLDLGLTLCCLLGMKLGSMGRILCLLGDLSLWLELLIHWLLWLLLRNLLGLRDGLWHGRYLHDVVPVPVVVPALRLILGA